MRQAWLLTMVIAMSLGAVPVQPALSQAPTGAISGVVTDAETGEPLHHVLVIARKSDSSASGITDANGRYTIRGLATGAYRVVARPAWEGILAISRTEGMRLESLLEQTYGRASPGPADPDTGTAVSVAALATTSGIDFALKKGGAITGVVINARTGAPVPLASVSVSGITSVSTGTDALGQYVAPGLPTGRYTIVAFAPDKYSGPDPPPLLDRVYDGISCLKPDCLQTAGTLVSVTAPNTTARIDFALPEGGVISGTVTDGATSSPVSGADVSFFNPAGERLWNTQTNDQGGYRSEGLPTGTYRVVGQPGYQRQNLLGQVYGGSSCGLGTCGPAGGSPVAVKAAENVTHIDMPLASGATMTGTITDASTGLPIPGAQVSVYADPHDMAIARTVTNKSGGYAVTGLGGGAYFVVAAPPSEQLLLAQVYGGTACAHDFACSIATGRPVATRSDGTIGNVDIAVGRGGAITGRVIASATGTPVAKVSVIVHDNSGRGVRGTTTNADGAYITGPLPSGSYYLRFEAPPELGLSNQLYRGGAYLEGSLEVRSGTPIPVTAPAAAAVLDAALTRGTVIAGTVRRANSGRPLDYFSIQVYTNTGILAATARSGEIRGAYATPALRAGTYFVRTIASESEGLIDQAYGGVDCPAGACAPTTGTAIVLKEPGTRSGIDFALRAGGQISGTIAPRPEGRWPLVVSFFSTTGAYVASSDYVLLGHYTSSGLPPGRYLVRTANTHGLVDQVYANVPCPTAGCEPETGTPVTVAVASGTTDVNFELRPGPAAALAIAPSSGPATGGTILTMLGPRFLVGATTVRIGGQTATSVAPNGTRTMTVVVPPGPPGPADVIVTTPSGTITLKAGFVYVSK